MKKDFSGSTREEAHRKAQEWWTSQKGLRETHPRTEIAIGDSANMREAERWAVTVHYETET
jgi:hypothetical protein